MTAQLNWRGVDVADWLVSTVRRNPEGLLLLAAGAALMVRTGRSGSAHRGRRRGGRGPHAEVSSRGFPGSDHLSGAMDDVRDTAADLGRDLGSRASEFGSGVANRASELGSRASEFGSRASEFGSRVSDTASSAFDTASRYATDTGRAVADRAGEFYDDAAETVQDTIGRMVEERPMMVALAGLAAGAAIAAVFPRTDVERRTLGPAGERITSFASETAGQFKAAGLAAGERLKSEADERGLNAEGLREMAHEAADAFSSAFKGDPQGQQRGKDTPRAGDDMERLD